MRRNITVTLDDELARWVRVEAAKRDTSVSAYLAGLLADRRQRMEGYDAARAAYLSREPRPLRRGGDPLPSRSDLYDRGAGG